MTINTTMPTLLKQYFRGELESYYHELNKGNLKAAWTHLERAHVVGQAYPWEHSYVHWKMLKYGIRVKNGKEIVGQLPRLLVGGVKSFVGKIPIGNTGGAAIPPLKSLPIPEDILAIFKEAGMENYGSQTSA